MSTSVDTRPAAYTAVCMAHPVDKRPEHRTKLRKCLVHTVWFGVTDTCPCLVCMCGVMGGELFFGIAECCPGLVWIFVVMGTHFLVLRTLSQVWFGR